MIKSGCLATIAFFLMLSGISFAGEAILSWECTTCAADGITGFYLYAGISSAAEIDAPADEVNPSPYDLRFDVPGGDTRSWSVVLPKGVWYFRLVAHDDVNNISKFSNEASGRVRPSRPTKLSFQN